MLLLKVYVEEMKTGSASQCEPSADARSTKQTHRHSHFLHHDHTSNLFVLCTPVSMDEIRSYSYPIQFKDLEKGFKHRRAPYISCVPWDVQAIMHARHKRLITLPLVFVIFNPCAGGRRPSFRVQRHPDIPTDIFGFNTSFLPCFNIWLTIDHMIEAQHQIGDVYPQHYLKPDAPFPRLNFFCSYWVFSSQPGTVSPNCLALSA